MNWLAHVLLSGDSAPLRIGGLLPDFLSRAEIRQLPPEFQIGADRHLIIDAFTDCHPVVRRSIARFENGQRRFGGILTDIFYDHFLSLTWAKHSDTRLACFVQEFYVSIQAHRTILPAHIVVKMETMIEENWLGSYGDFPGLEQTLRRVSGRFSRPVDLAAALPVFAARYEEFRSDFTEFFPELVQHVSAKEGRMQLNHTNDH
ncbi:MAG: ACP phosphodiesterase [Limisphaerales bacterium]